MVVRYACSILKEKRTMDRSIKRRFGSEDAVISLAEARWIAVTEVPAYVKAECIESTLAGIRASDGYSLTTGDIDLIRSVHEGDAIVTAWRESRFNPIHFVGRSSNRK